jgi:XTP/dITP diphosphohydrolase
MPAANNNRITIVLATANRDKVKELRPLLETISPLFNVVTLHELGVDVEIEETEETLEGNALLKARALFSRNGSLL